MTEANTSSSNRGAPTKYARQRKTGGKPQRRGCHNEHVDRKVVCRNERQVAEGALGRHGMCLPDDACACSKLRIAQRVWRTSNRRCFQRRQRCDGTHATSTVDAMTKTQCGQRACPEYREPSLASRHVFGHCRLGDLDHELEQLAMNAWRTPQRIRKAYLADEAAQLARDSWAPAACARLPAQYKRKPSRCHRTTVSGLTMVTAFSRDGRSRRWLG